MTSASLPSMLLLTAALGLWGGCTPAPDKLELISPQGKTLRVRGEQVHLEVVAVDRQGRRIADPKLRFWSSAPEVVGVFEDGVLVAKRSGSAQITATAGGKVTATLQLTVAIPGALEVHAGNLDALETGRSTPLYASVKSEDGRLLPDVAPRWSSSEESIARVETDAGGELKVVALKPGIAVLTAQVGELRRRLRVQVVRADFARLALEPTRVTLERPGQSARLLARAYDTVGRIIPQAPEIHWFSSEPRVVTVSPEGLVTAVAPGHVLISVQAGKRRASADVVVNAAPPNAVRRK